MLATAPPVVPRQPTGAAFDVVLLLHVGCAVVGLASMLVSAVQATRLRAHRSGDLIPDSLHRYYAPGTNWPGRALHGVPVLGVVLIVMSRHAYGFDDGWLLMGIGLWAAVAALGEGVLWPAEREVQQAVAALAGTARGTGDGSGSPAVVRGAQPVVLGRSCTLVVATAAVSVVLLVVAMVLMVAKP